MRLPGIRVRAAILGVLAAASLAATAATAMPASAAVTTPTSTGVLVFGPSAVAGLVDLHGHIDVTQLHGTTGMQFLVYRGATLIDTFDAEASAGSPGEYVYQWDTTTYPYASATVKAAAVGNGGVIALSRRPLALKNVNPALKVPTLGRDGGSVRVAGNFLPYHGTAHFYACWNAATTADEVTASCDAASAVSQAYAKTAAAVLIPLHAVIPGRSQPTRFITMTVTDYANATVVVVTKPIIVVT
jgi:hypothetical protein